VLGYDGVPQSYHPELPPEMNSLTDMTAYQGYWIKADADTVMPISGNNVPVDLAIPLRAGWNLLGYLPHEPLPVRDALASIEGKYEVVAGFDGTALTYYPQLPPEINTLKTLQPGHGYWISMTVAATLRYPTSPATTANDATSLPANDETARLAQVPEWVDFYGLNSTLNREPLPVGTIVTAAGPNAEKLGETVVNGEGRYGILSVIRPEGMQPGFPIRFYINGVLATTLGPDQPTWTSQGDLRHVELAASRITSHRSLMPIIVR